MPTPTSTAYWSGMSIVRMNVITMTTFWMVPVLHTDLRSSGLMVRKPMSMSRPASAGMAT